ncbi:MAG: DUF4055 domain-containing protein [Caulobacterales bacterium]|nr:DUF4055 domain-containing protein [Caulobacterales bacterium]
MGIDWPMLEALMGGTRAMRSGKEALLPKWPAEDEESYKARLSTSTLFPALRRTVSVMVGKPFSKALSFGEDVPVEIAGKPATKDEAALPGWADDIDREGVNLHTFASEMFEEGLTYGLAGILVEAPKPVQPAGAVVTKAEQDAAGVRPYWVRVKHNQILGWRSKAEGGRRVLTQLRILECDTVPDGDFGEKAVERVRVLTPGAWQVWEKGQKATDGKEWKLIEEGQTGLTVIPFVPIYGTRRGFMNGVSPLLDLAFLNTKHWQSQSDQDNILHVARVPILFLQGADDKTELTLGAGSAVKGPAGSDLKWVEHTGQAIKAGQESLEALEEQMIQAGAELLVKKPGDRSATESANDAEANKSDLQRIVEGFEDSLDQALYLTALYASLGQGGHVSLFKDFSANSLSEASGQLILALWQAGAISHDLLIEEQKRRGELAGEVDAQTERDKVAEEGGGLGTLGGERPARVEPEPEPEPADAEA